MPSDGAVRNRRRVEGSLAEPIWAAVISTAPQGRTHDRTRTRRRFCSIALEPKGPSTHDTELSRQGRQAALQRADDARGDAGGMPVHSHHCAEGLEPEGMRQPAQKLIAAILEDNRLGDHRAQPSHSIAQPFGHAAAVKRQVCATRAPHHQCSPVAVTLGAASGWDTIASATPNSSSSSAVLAGDWSKFDTVTPSSRMPLAVGSSVRTSSRLA